VRQTQTNLAKSGGQWTKRVNQIDSWGLKCLSIFTQEKLVKVLEIGDEAIFNYL
jgi:hypothetical protein